MIRKPIAVSSFSSTSQCAGVPAKFIASLIVAGLTATGVLVAASLLHAELFLGQHATWAFQHVNQFIRRRSHRVARRSGVPESLASARQADSQ